MFIEFKRGDDRFLVNTNHIIYIEAYDGKQCVMKTTWGDLITDTTFEDIRCQLKSLHLSRFFMPSGDLVE